MDSFNQKLTRKYKGKRVGTGPRVPAVYTTHELRYVWLSAVLHSRPQPHASHYNGSFRTKTLCELFRELFICVCVYGILVFIYIYVYLIFLPQNVKSRKNVFEKIGRIDKIIIIINIIYYITHTAVRKKVSPLYL